MALSQLFSVGFLLFLVGVDASLCLTGKGIKWFSHRLGAVKGHVCVGCVLNDVSHYHWAGWVTNTELDVCGLFEKSMFSSLHMGFQSRTEMQWESVWDGIVCLGDVLQWWWGNRKGCVSFPSGWLVMRAGWLLRNWCHEKICPVSSFWPSERQGDKAAKSITCHQQHGVSDGDLLLCHMAVALQCLTGAIYLIPSSILDWLSGLKQVISASMPARILADVFFQFMKLSWGQKLSHHSKQGDDKHCCNRNFKVTRLL